MTSTTTTATATAIHTRALLVWLTITTWSARRYDKSVTTKINADMAASSDAGRYNKMLLPGDAPSYKALVTLSGAIRAEHYSHSLAWSDEGWRLLPVTNYLAYTDWVRRRQSDLAVAVDAFIGDYASLKCQAASKLGAMYNAADYPSVDDLRSRFSLSLSYMPVPADGDIRVDLSVDQVESIERSITDKVTASLHTAMLDAYSRLSSVVAHVADRLSDPEAIFRDSLITNVRDVVASLARLNVTNDPQLEAMRLQAEDQLTRYTPESLRDNPRIRARVATAATYILSNMRANGLAV